MRKAKILVTGGAGFIGSHIVDTFIAQGHKVVVIDDLSSGSERNINKDAEFYKLDIRDPGVETVFKNELPTYVSHHAAQKDVRVSVTNPIYDAEINVLGTINILQNCVKYKIKKLIFASTGGAIYGEQEVFPAPETHQLMPISPYGITKLAAEYYLYYYKTIFGLDYVSLRYSNVYGPRQDPHGEAGVIAIFIQKMLHSESPVINGDGKQTRDFVYVEDVAKANLIAIDNNSYNIFNIGTGIETSIEQVFSNLRKIINPSIKRKYGPALKGEQLRSVVEITRAKEKLHWVSEFSLIDGLKKTCSYFSSLM